MGPDVSNVLRNDRRVGIYSDDLTPDAVSPYAAGGATRYRDLQHLQRPPSPMCQFFFSPTRAKANVLHTHQPPGR